VSKGQSKPETVSIRIREETYVAISEYAKSKGIKIVDAIDVLVDAWFEDRPLDK
jgi:PHP family Zn ribbon phosphoesterase